MVNSIAKILGDYLASFFPTGSLFPQKTKMHKSKVHDYTQFNCGRDYIFEPINRGEKAYMTGRGKGIEVGDSLILSNGSNFRQYRVEKVDYYFDESDTWIAVLKYKQ